MQWKFMTIIMLGLISIVGCKDDDDDMEDPVAMQIEEVRMETVDYIDYNAAVEAGWDTHLSQCVEHPTEGGMGHHIARMEYIDGRVNHLEPQVLLYAYNDEGEFEFLGVEYIVPFDILPEDEDPPVLFEQEFHKNQQLELWALHVWTEKENSNGMFFDWNPDVNCQPWIDMLLDEVRELTSPYTDQEAAIQAGWNTDLSGCVEHPSEGGMGHHYARLEYMDDEVDHLKPEVLLYAPGEGGEMEFVAVEYVVPFQEVPEDEDPPILFNQAFHKNQQLEIWALHVWTEKENSNGIFYDWNPDVSCD